VITGGSDNYNCSFRAGPSHAYRKPNPNLNPSPYLNHNSNPNHNPIKNDQARNEQLYFHRPVLKIEKVIKIRKCYLTRGSPCIMYIV